MYYILQNLLLNHLFVKVDPKFLRNMRFAKKHNKRNRKSQEMDTA